MFEIALAAFMLLLLFWQLYRYLSAPKPDEYTTKYIYLMSYMARNLPSNVRNSNNRKAIVNIPMKISPGKKGSKYLFSIDLIDEVKKSYIHGKKYPYNEAKNGSYKFLLAVVGKYLKENNITLDEAKCKTIDIPIPLSIKVHSKKPNLRIVDISRFTSSSKTKLPSEVPAQQQ